MEQSPAWLTYQPAITQCLAQLRTKPDITVLLSHSAKLSSIRLSLPTPALRYWLQNAVPDAVKQVELVLLYCQQQHWPKAQTQLLLQAAFCCLLLPALPQSKQWPALKPYPALIAARLIKNHDVRALYNLLSGCYPLQRKVPPWQQNPASLLLSLSATLTSNAPELGLLEHIGRQIGSSKSDAELSLLQQLLTMFFRPEQHCQRQLYRDNLLYASRYLPLIDADSRQIINYLGQSTQLSTPVLQQATSLNRQRQPIHDVKLALNLLGRQRWPHIIASAELKHALAALQHPQHWLLLQIQHTLSQALQLLLPDSPETEVLACCLAAPLWLTDTSYQTGLLYRTACGLQPAVNTRTYTNGTALTLIQPLLEHYQLSNWHPAVQQWLYCLSHNTAASAGSVIYLQLAWQSSLAVFALTAPKAITPLLQKLPDTALASTNSSDWLTQLAIQANCQFPLQLYL